MDATSLQHKVKLNIFMEIRIHACFFFKKNQIQNKRRVNMTGAEDACLTGFFFFF